jgi:hypothetical protein
VVISATPLSWTLPQFFVKYEIIPERAIWLLCFFAGPFPAMKTWHLAPFFAATARLRHQEERPACSPCLGPFATITRPSPESTISGDFN